MKTITKIVAMAMVAATVFTSCNQDDEDDDDSTLPDATFNATVTGAINQDLNISLPENFVSGTKVVNGSLNGSSNLFVMNAQDIGTWTFALIYNGSQLQVGTYDVAATSAFSYPSQAQAAFSATSGTVSISKAELFQGVGSGVGAADDYFVDGTFTIQMESTDTPPQQLQISGSFSGVNIKVN